MFAAGVLCIIAIAQFSGGAIIKSWRTCQKNDIKEIFTEALEPFANAIKADFNSVNGRLDKIEGRLDKVEADVKWMKDNSSALFEKLDKFIKLYEDQKLEKLKESKPAEMQEELTEEEKLIQKQIEELNKLKELYK